MTWAELVQTVAQSNDLVLLQKFSRHRTWQVLGERKSRSIRRKSVRGMMLVASRNLELNFPPPVVILGVTDERCQYQVGVLENK